MSVSPPITILFGGSFDPVHEGHLKTADAIRQLFDIPAVALLPAARSPLKPASTADSHRLAMLQLAIEAYPGLVIDDRELRRAPPSYTVDTLRECRTELGNAAPLGWVMGADTLSGLSQWKHWQALTDLAHLITVERPRAAWPDSGTVKTWLDSLPSVVNVDQLQCSPYGKLLRLTLPPQPFSSTAIRAELNQRKPDSAKPDGLPDSVWRYILQHDLYLSGTLPDTGHEAL
ncbi:MAG TPA: nicotinate-nucleotide adenylyltransferase [Pseudomonadales bacterium]|nr:nicotinate-nucleotide adenylyltransferase [Pseudomonadales bacterium]